MSNKTNTTVMKMVEADRSSNKLDSVPNSSSESSSASPAESDASSQRDGVSSAHARALKEITPLVCEIPESELNSRYIPVHTLIQGALTLRTWCEPDRILLENAGLNWGLVEQLPTVAGALKEAQSKWGNGRFEREEEERNWSRVSKKAIRVRRETMHNMRYAFSDDAELLETLTHIGNRSSTDDLIQDINDLYVLGMEHQESLLKVGVSMDKLVLLANLSEELGQLKAMAVVKGSTMRASKLLRDQVYTYLRQNMDVIRKCGQFVFWQNQSRLAGYSIAYFNKKRKNTRPKNNQTEVSTQTVTNPPQLP